MQSHIENNHYFPCEQCGLVSVTQEDMLQHVKGEHAPEMKAAPKRKPETMTVESGKKKRKAH